MNCLLETQVLILKDDKDIADKYPTCFLKRLFFLFLFHRGLTEHGTDQQKRRKHNPERRC